MSNLLVGIIWSAVVSAWEGLVFTILWKWYVAKKFSVPQITIPQAVGLAMIVSMATFQTATKDGELEKERISNAIMVPLTALIFGWAWHFWA
jgi:hypothetical protein